MKKLAMLSFVFLLVVNVGCSNTPQLPPPIERFREIEPIHAPIGDIGRSLIAVEGEEYVVFHYSPGQRPVSETAIAEGEIERLILSSG